MKPLDPEPGQSGQCLTEADRRGEPRHTCAESVRCFAPVLGQRCWARVKDVSPTGVGLVLGRSVRPRTPLVITGPDTDSAGLEVRVEVAHCTRCCGDYWLVGCRFDARLSQGELLKLLTHWC